MDETVVRLRHHAVLTPGPGGDPTDEAVSLALAPGGRIVVLWTSRARAEATRARITAASGVTFPESRMSADVSARVTVHAPDAVEAARIPRLSVSHPYAQLLPEDRVLLVGARAAWRPEPEGPERNAVLHDADGHVLAEGVFGDGVAGIATTPSGNCWVRYFDEGIFGNFGWGYDGAPPPVGESGLVRFGPDLARNWSYSERGAGLPGMWGTPALNVDGETAWVSYEQANDIVRIADGRTTCWTQDALARIHVLAVGADRVAALGRPHGDDGPDYLTGTLADGRFDATAGFRLALPDGSPLPERWQVFAQGPDLHVVCGQDWYRVGLDDLP
ncbi:hypothetical protein [Yinghuangia sp. YIM S09857]|uniref:hypothetical protein n=1 Tax=Yinghuangia sp. YIM S09857 TaxID=3436929 RepID=UPI003F53BA60